MKSIECFWRRFPLMRAAMNTVFILLLMLAGTGSKANGAEKLSQTDKAKLASEVKVLFRNKCAKCHGPVGVRETKKPKGEIDYILDLAKLSSNPKIIVQGDPDESKLFNMVADFLMPDDQAGEEPLPKKEIELIRRWILAGAPTEEGTQATINYHCPATKILDLGTLYSPEQLKNGQFSTRLEELSEGTFISQCAFSVSDQKVLCVRDKVDRVEFEPNLNIKKVYVFHAQINFQLFPDLNSLADNGTGRIQYGKCEFVSP